MYVFPPPRIDDTLDFLSGAKYFTTLDLASGYWQMCLDQASQEKTASVAYSGLCEFKKMPATFQRLMVVLTGLVGGGCMDDVLVIILLAKFLGAQQQSSQSVGAAKVSWSHIET